MATKSIFRSFTLPNGKEMRTMREDVRNAALQAVRDKCGSNLLVDDLSTKEAGSRIERVKPVAR